MTWKPGESGNPRGPKPGTSAQQKLRKAIEKDLKDIIEAMTTAAKAGDTSAAKLLMDKVLPNLKPETRPPSLPAPIQPDAILEAVGAGIITTDQARELMALAESRAKIAEGVENTERLTRIEELLKKPG